MKRTNKLKTKLNLFIIPVFFLGIILFGSACSNDKEFQTTDSGLTYKFIEKGEGDKAEEGEVYMINMMYSDENDSVIANSSFDGGMFPIRYEQEAWENGGMIYSAIGMMGKGDSAVFKIPATDFFVKSAGSSIPPGIDSASSLNFYIGVQDVISDAELETYQREQMAKQRAEMAKQSAAQMSEDSAKIEAYLDENNIDAQTTESGVRYVITEEGSGKKANPGDSVLVHYRGTLLDGTQFDASYDRDEPLPFVLGQGMVIPGWDEGIQQLQVGDKAKLFIPSPLAYGPTQRGPIISPNSVLVFEVELLEAK